MKSDQFRQLCRKLSLNLNNVPLLRTEVKGDFNIHARIYGAKSTFSILKENVRPWIKTCKFHNFCRHIVVIFVTPDRWLSKIHIVFFFMWKRTLCPLKYRTRAIITRSRFETALDYKPRIFKIRKVSLNHKLLCNINRGLYSIGIICNISFEDFFSWII